MDDTLPFSVPVWIATYSSTSIKLLIFQIGIVRIQMEMLMEASSLNSNSCLCLLAGGAHSLPRSHTWNFQAFAKCVRLFMQAEPKIASCLLQFFFFYFCLDFCVRWQFYVFPFRTILAYTTNIQTSFNTGKLPETQ